MQKFLSLTSDEQLEQKKYVQKGDILAKIPNEIMVKNRDITGGPSRSGIV